MSCTECERLRDALLDADLDDANVHSELWAKSAAKLYSSEVEELGARLHKVKQWRRYVSTTLRHPCMEFSEY